MEIIETTALISINTTLWVQLFSFLIFLFIINRVMFRPLRRTMSARKEYIDRIKQEIQADRSEIEAILAEMAASEQRIKFEAHKIREKMVQKGVKQAEGVLAETRQEAQLMQRQAGKELAVALVDARVQIEGQARQVATTIVDHILERRMTQ